MPGGGIMLACILRIIRSATSASWPAFARSNDVSVRLPARSLLRSLWQPTQYFLTRPLPSTTETWVKAAPACGEALLTVFTGGCETAGLVAAAGFATDGDVAVGCWAAITLTSPRHTTEVPRDIKPALLISKSPRGRLANRPFCACCAFCGRSRR